MNVSTRYVPHIVGLALLAGAVVWPASLSPRRADPCLHPDVLPVTGLIPDSKPEGERRERRSDEVIQWSEGQITSKPLGSETPLFFRILRTYNVLRTAQRPLLLMPKPMEPEQVRLETVEAPGGSLPIHLIRSTGPDVFRIAAYVFLYGNDPVPHPFPLQVRRALRAPWEGQPPLTIFFVGGSATRETAKEREAVAIHWIASAWQQYRSVCLPRAEAAS